MNALPSLKKDWVLTQAAFDKLLACLDSDRNCAAQQYEAIRESLIMFFENRGSYSPEDHADDTINRVARRLDEGQQIYAVNPATYFYGVARNVLKELWEAPERLSPRADELPPHGVVSIRSDDPKQDDEKRRELELRLECLEGCLERLPRETQQLIIRYYREESGAKIDNRKQLARQLGISLNALRNKTLRIREKLEGCVSSCLKHTDS